MSDVESVTIKLAELLRHPEDLDKISSLKSEFTRKKGAVDSQLKLGLKEQLEVTQAGMNSITEGNRTVNLIKEEMMKIDKLCAEAQNMIRDFPDINLVAQTHRNFELVGKMKEDIDSFDQRLSELESLLREDDDDLENQPNLLLVHYGLTQLREIKDTALGQLRDSKDTSMELINNLRLETGSTLQDYFNRLDDVIDWFDGHVGNACMNLIPLIQSGNNGMVVRLALVIEEEDKNDKKVKALQEAHREYKELATRFKSIASLPRELRGYKEKFLQAIEMTGSAQIQDANQKFLEDPDKLEKSVRWYFNDLNTVKLGMENLMPKKWKIFQTYVKIYHKLMHDWLITRIDDKELQPVHMLAIINWGDKYYTKMKKLGVSELDLTPHLLDDRGTELVREYRQLIIKAVEEWMERMAVTDKQSFVSRNDSYLDTDENGCFRTKTLGDMWRMLREQLLVAGNSERNDVAEGVVDAMFRALTSRQQMWESLVDLELAKYNQATTESEGLQSLQDWLLAIANDQIACIDDGDDGTEEKLSYLSRFTREFTPLVSPTYAAAVSANIDTLTNGYVDLSAHCIAVFVALIFAVDFKTIVTEFFTPTWYSQKRFGQIISTFQDYLADYERVLHPSLRDILVEELSDELLRTYLSSVFNRSVKFRRTTDPFVDKIKDDVLTAFGFFEQFPGVWSGIKDKWRVVDGFVQLLESEKIGVPSVYERFKMDYWDVQIGWIEMVLRTRDDFDRALLNSVKAKAVGVYVDRGPETIMSKVRSK